jgi:UDP-N-acetylglucosamine acyltransferase
VEDRVLISAHSAVHQFCRVGTLAMIAGGAMAVQDIPPYCLAHGNRARLRGLNEVGLDRAGLSDEAIRGLRRAYRVIFRSGLPRKQGLCKAREDWGHLPETTHLLDFIAASKRGIARHGRD